MKSLMSIMKDPRIVGAMGVAEELKLTEELGRAQFLSQGWQKGSTKCRCLPKLAIIGGRNFKTTFLALPDRPL